MSAFVRFDRVKKVYHMGEVEIEALRDATFSVEKGELCVIVGPSGAGKTTLLNILGGMDTLSEGRVFLGEEEISAYSARQLTAYRRHDIGFVFQSFQLIPELTVEQNIAFPLLLDCRKPDGRELLELLNLLGLAPRRNHLPSQLSGGQQQRTAIGRALIHRPMLILADEPTGNLDSKNSQEVMELLTQAARHYRQTILMITHNPGLTAYADRVLQVTDGILTDLGGNCNEKLS